MTIIVHDKRLRYGCNAYKDHLPHPSSGKWFQSEAYVCGDIPPHYPVPATLGNAYAASAQYIEDNYIFDMMQQRYDGYY